MKFNYLMGLCLFCATFLLHQGHAVIEGDSCIDDASCQSTTTFLECDADRKCRCQEAPSTYFDTGDNKCHRYVGDACWFQIIMPCSLNGVCHPGTQVCQCNGGYNVTSTKKCAHMYGGLCTVDFNCDRDNFMKCVTMSTSRTCACDPDTSIVDSSQTKCLLLLNQPCSTSVGSQECAEQLECKTDGDDDLKCRCPEGTSENNGECQIDFGGSCSDDLHCNAGKYLICIDGTCACVDDFEHTGDGGCQANYGHSCEADVPCSQNQFLECDETDKLCKCANGLIDIGGACRSGFDETCGIGLAPCNEQQFHDCINEKCHCQHDLVDLGGGNCRSEFGHSCDPSQAPCDETNFLACGPEAICHCRDGLSASPEGRCVASWEDSCANGEPCDSNQFLICDADNKCSCDSTGAHWDQNSLLCVLEFGSSCQAGSGHQPCDPSQLLVCRSTDGKCGCEVGSIFDPVLQKCVPNDGVVRPGFPCLGDNDCLSDLTFLECDLEALPFPQCQCTGNGTAYFETADGKCHKFVEEECDDTGGMACSLNGGCDPFEIPATCKCFETHDFHETSTRKCAKPHGAICSESTECDRDAFVECTGGRKCGCDVDAWFNPSTKTCLLLADAPCNPDHNVTEKPQTCAPNSFCSFLDQKCHCEDGLYQNDQRRCFLKAGEPCNPLDDDGLCDFTQFHQCDPIEAKCGCSKDDNVVEEYAGMCRLRANALCSLDVGAQECTTHSTCVPADSTNLCKCDAGLIPNKVGKCVLTYGLPCGGDVRGTCDAEGFQSCQDGHCTCLNEDQMVYEPTFEKCSLKLNSPCVPGGVITCREHASCDKINQKCQCNDGWIEDGQGNCI